MPKSEGALELVLSWYGVDPWVNTPIKGKDHLCKPAQLPGRLPPSPSTLPHPPQSASMPIFGYFYFENLGTNWENRAGKNGRTLDVMGVEKCVWFSSIYRQSPFATSSATSYLLPFHSSISSFFQWLAALGYSTKGCSGRQYGYYSLGVYLCSLE